MSALIAVKHPGGHLYAIVDDEYAHLSQWSWYLCQGYVQRTKPRQPGETKPNHIKMHREILGLPKGVGITDHINGDRLDNRRANLRTVTSSGNAQNRRAKRDSRSGLRGVYWMSRINKWGARVRRGTEDYFLGYFDDAMEASRVVESKRRELGFLGSEAA